MGHARQTDIQDCTHEYIEDTLGYKNVAQLSIDGPDVNWKFSNKFEKTKETSCKTDLVNVGSCSFKKLLNVFEEG